MLVCSLSEYVQFPVDMATIDILVVLPPFRMVLSKFEL